MARSNRAGFTMTELLVVVGIIALLLAILLPALSSVVSGGKTVESMNNLRQISNWMQLYGGENRDTILPSQFDYSADPDPGLVRSGPVAMGVEHQGTWADILWTIHDLGDFGDPNDPTLPAYKYDSPDKELYAPADANGDLINPRINPDEIDNPLRSTRPNTRNAIDDPLAALPRPYGLGAHEKGLPGFFAANNFFDARPAANGGNGWYSSGQIRFPDRSLYLIDSFAGEIIEDECEAFYFPSDGSAGTGEVDFRYGGTCLILFLDGHTDSEGGWIGLDQLQQTPGRGVRVQELDRRGDPAPCS